METHCVDDCIYFVTCFQREYARPFLTEEATQSFDNFVDLLGERIALKGWEKFKGGLDVKSRCDFN